MRKGAFGLVVELVLGRLHDRSGRFLCACTTRWTNRYLSHSFVIRPVLRICTNISHIFVRAWIWCTNIFVVVGAWAWWCTNTNVLSAGPRVSCTNIFVRTSKFVGTGSEPDETFRVGKALLVEMKNCASAVFQIDNTKVNERKSIMYVSSFESIIFVSFIHLFCTSECSPHPVRRFFVDPKNLTNTNKTHYKALITQNRNNHGRTTPSSLVDHNFLHLWL